MKRTLNCLFYLFLTCLIFSCKNPVTIVFDKPIGEIKSGFGKEIQGNYFLMDELVKSELKRINDDFIISGDKIYLEGDTGYKPAPDLNDKVNIGDSPVDTTALQDNGIASFKTLAFYNTIMFIDSSPVLKNFKEKLTIFRVNAKDIEFIAVDSSGNNVRMTIFSLSDKVILSCYKGKYFLNFKTDLGYEVAMIDLWNEDYLGIKPLYYTGYDEYTQDGKKLMKDLNSWYPGLKPVYADAKKIIAVKGKMKPDKVMMLFDKSETHYDLYRVK
jgi:hypothetical protein